MRLAATGPRDQEEEVPEAPMMPDELAKIGLLMFGERWKKPLARQLRVHRQTVIGWSDKKWSIPEKRAVQLRGVALLRAMEICQLLGIPVGRLLRE